MATYLEPGVLAFDWSYILLQWILSERLGSSSEVNLLFGQNVLDPLHYERCKVLPSVSSSEPIPGNQQGLKEWAGWGCQGHQGVVPSRVRLQVIAPRPCSGAEGTKLGVGFG